jgi:hypothetical protein
MNIVLVKHNESSKQERMEICAANALKAAQNQLEEIYHGQKQ